MYKTVFRGLNINGARIKYSCNNGVKKTNIIDDNDFFAEILIKKNIHQWYFIVYLFAWAYSNVLEGRGKN